MPRSPDVEPRTAPKAAEPRTAADAGAAEPRTARHKSAVGARTARDKSAVGARTARDTHGPGLARKASSCAAPRLRVVAGILRDAQGRVLLAERLHDHPFAGLWEFPGGKLDGRETPAAALRRELLEELDVEIAAFEPFLTVTHDYPDRSVEIDFFLVTEWRGDLRPMLGQRLRWVMPEALVADELLPANSAVVTALNSAL